MSNSGNVLQLRLHEELVGLHRASAVVCFYTPAATLTSAVFISIKTEGIDHGAVQPVRESQRWDRGVSEDVGRGCIRRGHRGQQHCYSCKAAGCVHVFCYQNDMNLHLQVTFYKY